MKDNRDLNRLQIVTSWKNFSNFAATMTTEIIHIEESEYNSILLQAVAVIDKARTN